MAKVLDDLRRDHVNMGTLLDLLEAQLHHLEEAGAPDLELMLEILDYSGNYPDLCHHPKEDLVYRRLMERAPETRAAVEDLLSEHEAIVQGTKDMADTLNNLLLDAEVSRAAVVEHLRDYIASNRRHIDKEEADILGRAEAALSAADWNEIDAAIAADDPLFGAAVQEKYRSLHHNIVMI